jgi:hypothetical protein
MSPFKPLPITLSVIFKRTSNTVLRFKFLVGDPHEEYPDHGRAFIAENGFEFPMEDATSAGGL